MGDDDLRARMVDEQIRSRGLTEQRLVAAFCKVPRHLFVPAKLRNEAYADHPLPIGEGQTISQPYMVALMTDCLRLHGHERVLEIGTGSGYQTAILAELALEVFSVERIPILLNRAKDVLERLGYQNVNLRHGNGSIGWEEAAPFDAILVSAAAPRVPEALLAQLADQGKLVLPIGERDAQQLVEVRKCSGIVQQREIAGCVFVPLIGEHGWPLEERS